MATKALIGILILAALAPIGCGDDEASDRELKASIKRMYTATAERDVPGICDSMLALEPREFGTLTAEDLAMRVEEQDRWCEHDFGLGLRGFEKNFPAEAGAYRVDDITVDGPTARARIEGERNGRPDSGTLKLAKPADGPWRVVLAFLPPD